MPIDFDRGGNGKQGWIAAFDPELTKGKKNDDQAKSCFRESLTMEVNATEYLRSALEIKLAQGIPPKLSYAGIEEVTNAVLQSERWQIV